MTIATHKGKTVHMDTTVKAPAVEAAKAKATRGQGPIKVRFVNTVEGKPSEVSDKAVNVEAIIVELREGETVKESKTFPLSALNDETLNSFAALGYARVLETYMRNHAQPNGSDAIGHAVKRNGELVEGKLYVRSARGEGGSAKGADVTVYVEAFKIAMKLRKVQITDEQVAGFQAKLEATKGKDRLAAIGKLNKDVIFKRALLEAKLNLAKDSAKSGTVKKDDNVNYLDLI